MRRLLWRLSRLMGLNALMRFLHRNHLIILLYHGVAPRERFGIYNYRGKFVTPESFRKQARFLSTHYNVLELEDALTRLHVGTLPPYAAVITFDDGYRNFYDHAFPILKEFSLPACIFLVNDFVLREKPLWVDRLEYAIGQGTGPYQEKTLRDARLRAEMKQMPDDERKQALTTAEDGVVALHDFSNERKVYAPLTRDMVAEIRSGRISIGAHTLSHPILSSLRQEEARHEVAESIRELTSAVGPLVPVFAYPNGQQNDYTEETIVLVRKAGCVAALTTREGMVKREDDPFSLQRITIDGIEDEDAFLAALSGARKLIRKLKMYA